MHNVDIFRKSPISIKLISLSLADFSSDWTGKVNWWTDETAFGLYVAVIFVVLLLCTCICPLWFAFLCGVFSLLLVIWLLACYFNKQELNWTEPNYTLPVFFVQNWPHMYLKQKHAITSHSVIKCYYLITNLFTSNACLIPLLFSNVLNL